MSVAFFIVTLNLIMLTVIMLSVVMLSVIMLSVIVLSVVMLSVVMLSVKAPVLLTCPRLMQAYPRMTSFFVYTSSSQPISPQALLFPGLDIPISKNPTNVRQFFTR
jgi:hypothetical protein